MLMKTVDVDETSMRHLGTWGKLDSFAQTRNCSHRPPSRWLQSFLLSHSHQDLVSVLVEGSSSPGAGGCLGPACLAGHLGFLGCWSKVLLSRGRNTDVCFLLAWEARLPSLGLDRATSLPLRGFPQPASCGDTALCSLPRGSLALVPAPVPTPSS